MIAHPAVRASQDRHHRRRKRERGLGSRYGRGGSKVRRRLLLGDVQPIVRIKMLRTLEKPHLFLSGSYAVRLGSAHSRAGAAQPGDAARSLSLSQSRAAEPGTAGDRGEPALPESPPLPCAAPARGAPCGAGLWAELCCSKGPRRSTLGPERLLCGIMCLESCLKQLRQFPGPRATGDGGGLLPAGCVWGKASRRPRSLSGRPHRVSVQPIPPYPILFRSIPQPFRALPRGRARGSQRNYNFHGASGGRPDGHVTAVAAVT